MLSALRLPWSFGCGWLSEGPMPARDAAAVDPLERSTYLAAEARKSDPDRYLCALFAPAERRDAVLGLVLFHHELARVAEIVSQPMAGLIRYQWWREAVAETAAGQPPRQHPVVLELAQALRLGWVAEADLMALIDAREPALERLGASDPAELEAFTAATSGAVQAVIYRALGGADAAGEGAARAIGTALGLVGMVRALRFELARPASPRQDEPVRRPHDEVAGVIDVLTARSGELVAEGRRAAGQPTRTCMPAFLPASLTTAYLGQLRTNQAQATELIRPPLAPVVLGLRVLLRRP